MYHSLLPPANVFTPVCQSFCSRGREYLGRYTPAGRYTTPQAGTSPPGQVHPPGRYTPTPQAVTPAGRYTPQGRYNPREQCMLGDTGNKWAVRILLEYILVSEI